MDVTINETEIKPPSEIATWGDLLDWIESDYLKAGQCITHVYLGGSVTYNYRDRLLCDQDLQAVGKVSVHSDDFDRIVHESLAELDRELADTRAGIQDIVRLFENRKEEEAYTRLAQLLEAIRVFFTIFSEDLGWVEPVDAEIARKEYSAALERSLTQLIPAQERRNWVSVCDVLEYEITPILESWHKMVARTREHLNE
jgi:hypothetical protein